MLLIILITVLLAIIGTGLYILYDWYYNPIKTAKRQLKKEKKAYKWAVSSITEIQQSYLVAMARNDTKMMEFQVMCYKVLESSRQELKQHIKETIQYLQNVESN